MNPGISERTYEFCYNAEFCFTYTALLASHPHIPSQRQEKDLGYDVEMRINQGGFTRSLFLQHKVASYAEKKAGKNARFYDRHNGRYFRFPLDTDQHNTLHDLSLTSGNAYYCAPLFHNRTDLETHFRANAIMANSVWIDPADFGEITDGDQHHITYDPTGGTAYFHSEVRELKPFVMKERTLPPNIKQQEINRDYVQRLNKEIVEKTMSSKFRPTINREVERLREVERIQYLLGHVYDVTWLLLP